MVVQRSVVWGVISVPLCWGFYFFANKFLYFYGDVSTTYLCFQVKVACLIACYIVSMKALIASSILLLFDKLKFKFILAFISSLPSFQSVFALQSFGVLLKYWLPLCWVLQLYVCDLMLSHKVCPRHDYKYGPKHKNEMIIFLHKHQINILLISEIHFTNKSYFKTPTTNSIISTTLEHLIEKTQIRFFLWYTEN